MGRNIQQSEMLSRVPEENFWYIWPQEVEDTSNEENSNSDLDSDEGKSGGLH